ncbi:Zinc finger protein [Colletotrichum aenigma]|uniref:Zinc finger protein n=1 Tax=Colletotrichum aenigma TaxID=1215731 RepID=UPI001872D7AC|nr:Zinc finger protein [Colletotrichum aenigma]KAF5521271.1 Zinc finger protein [Colletotrichum aenigma]
MELSRPFTCTECSQTFTRNENLERHKRSRHGSDSRRPFKCYTCRARFTRKDVCKRHSERCRGALGRVLTVPGTEGEPEQTESVIDETALSSNGQEADDSPEANASVDTTVAMNDETYHGSSPETGGGTVSRDLLSSEFMINHSESFIAAYFECFHPSFPLLHHQSVRRDMPKLSKQILVAIGILYSRPRHSSEEDADFVLRQSQTMWQDGQEELWRLVETDWREIRRTWVMQAWLLHIIYGAFTGNATHFDKAKKMLRWVVDAARDLGLLRQSVFTSTTRFHDGEEQTLHDHWMSYVESESMKLCMYTILFLDSHIFSPCNIRPLTTPIELDWELPLPGALWEADTSLSWAQRLGDEPPQLAQANSSNWHILKFADRIALSVKLALCKPDDLLIGGIVENSVVAGLTTATHLTLGLQVGARRSLQNLLRYNSGDDGMLVFLDDLMDVLSSVTSLDKQDPLREVPWATVATYRILLAIWRLLRWATGEMSRKAGSQTTVRSRFEASTIVFNSILEVISSPEELESQTRRLSRPARETTALGMTSDDSEARFMETVLQFWKDRPVWSMGSFMTTVLEEIISAGGMAYELRGAE